MIPQLIESPADRRIHNVKGSELRTKVMEEALTSIRPKISQGEPLISMLSTRLSLQGKFSIHRNVESKHFIKFALFLLCTMHRNVTIMKKTIKFNNNDYKHNHLH